MTDRFEPRIWAPERLAALRRSVETTDIPLYAIADEHHVPRSTFYQLVRREGWRRPGDDPPTTPPADAAPIAPIAPAVRAGRAVRATPAARVRRPARSAAPAIGTLADRLERAVAREIAALEASRSAPPERSGSARRSTAQRSAASDTERVVRSLERLTDTLAKVRRLREPLPSDPDDDLPRDIDEFRRVLARRIEQLVRGGTDRDDAGGPAGDGAAEARG
ncbi:hypothetical protein [Rhodoplanes azumiensis]|uniref:Helix-turn-helix domain-containing protein n=1 Tax=Rhodoplanes azumiensis TaxID=1897628 RepID=A0ABW5AFG0_9BRAD